MKVLVSVSLLCALAAACGEPPERSKTQQKTPAPTPEVMPGPAPAVEVPVVDPSQSATKPVVVAVPVTSGDKGSANQSTPVVDTSKDCGCKGKPTTPSLPTAPTVPVTPPVTPSKGEEDCTTVVLDFEKKADGSVFLTGEKLKDQYKNLGVEIMSHKRLANGQLQTNLAPIIFDSRERPNQNYLNIWKHIDCTYGNCEGFDSDLATEKNGNLLIVSEYSYDINPADNLDFVTYPDDNELGGVIKFFFSKPTKVLSIDLVDVENNSSNLELWNKSIADYALKATYPIVGKANGSLQTMALAAPAYSDKLMVNLAASGAIDNLKICIKK